MYIFQPFYNLVAEVFPSLEKTFHMMKENREAWNHYDDKLLAEELGQCY
jgi:hypothetical protein